jgi:monoamine oxidase
VVAVPVALLGDLRFDPPLDPAIDDGIAAIRTGSAAKLAVPLREPATPRAVMSAADRFWIWTTPSDEAGVRSVGAWAGAAPVLERLGVGAGAERWLDRVEDLCPDLALDRAGARLTVWEQDPWARGAYSVLPPRRTRPAELAAAPAAPNLVFAGEHTAEPGWTGTMEGALRSGKRAASELERRARGI